MCVYRCVCVCVCVCVKVWLPLPLYYSSRSPSLFSLCCLLPSFSLSALLSTCRALAVNQPAELCLLPLTFWAALFWSLIGWQESVAENYGLAHMRLCVSLCVCVRERRILQGGWLEWQVVVFLELHTPHILLMLFFFRFPLLMAHKEDSLRECVYA